MPIHVFIWQTGNDTQKRDLIIFLKHKKAKNVERHSEISNQVLIRKE